MAWLTWARFFEKESFVSKQDLDEAFLRSLLKGNEVEMSVVFSDPSLPDKAMIFVSDEFAEQTGYRPEEALG